MNTGITPAVQAFRPQLLERRARLQEVSGAVRTDDLERLLQEIDSALHRIDHGTFGLCESCGDPIEADRLERDSLVRFCLDHLSASERKAHQNDLELASQIQSRLLPDRDIVSGIWDAHYRYEPVGAVGGDYCELAAMGDGESIFFAVGDVSGKGVAASLLMTHLSAIFRSLLPMELPLADMVARANHLLCEATAAAHFATLACGRAAADRVEICNAGHCAPLLLRGNMTERFGATGLPLGLFCGGRYEVQQASLAPGDSLVLYSDGITEARGPGDEDYGEQRLLRALRQGAAQDARGMAQGVVNDVIGFRGAQAQHDDMTLLIVRRQG